MIEFDSMDNIRDARADPPSAWMTVDSITDIEGRAVTPEFGKIKQKCFYFRVYKLKKKKVLR